MFEEIVKELELMLASNITKMKKTVEDSPYHREASVWEHTQMVLTHCKAIMCHLNKKEQLVAQLACFFHDIGKPEVEQVKFKEGRGSYKAYYNHEGYSSMLFENIACKNKKLFNMFTKQELYAIAWMLDKHLYYKQDVAEVCHTLMYFNEVLCKDSGINWLACFKVLIESDTCGRTSDNKDGAVLTLLEYCDALDSAQHTVKAYDLAKFKEKTCYILIGASGSGKSTFTSTLNNVSSFSWDTIRVALYEKLAPVNELKNQTVLETYESAHKFCVTHRDKFNQVCQTELKDLLRSGVDFAIDNTNVIKHNRSAFINDAKKYGYKVVGVYFLNDLETLQARNKERTDHMAPLNIVIKQYFNTNKPVIGEVDLIQVI